MILELQNSKTNHIYSLLKIKNTKSLVLELHSQWKDNISLYQIHFLFIH